jgi:hypothetical protein
MPIGLTQMQINMCDRTSQSPELVVGGWCSTKYGLAIAKQETKVAISNHAAL